MSTRYLGRQCHGTPEELALMATLKRCDCGNSVLTVGAEACTVACNNDECGEHWDALTYEEAIRIWNEEMHSEQLADEIIGGFF